VPSGQNDVLILWLWDLQWLPFPLTNCPPIQDFVWRPYIPGSFVPVYFGFSELFLAHTIGFLQRHIFYIFNVVGFLHAFSAHIVVVIV